MKITRCPYCGKRLNYFQAFAERKHGEYTCRNCGRNSTVYFSKSYKVVVGVAILLAIVLVIIAINPIFLKNMWGMLWVASPFLILYIITPFFLKLVPIKKKKDNIDYGRFGNSLSDDVLFSNELGDTSRTRVVPSVEINNKTDEYLDISDLNL